MLKARQTLYSTKINQIFQVLVQMRKMRNNEIADVVQNNVSMMNQLMLQNLMISSFLLIQLERVTKQVLTIKTKQIMSRFNVYIVRERKIQQFVIIRFLKNDLKQLQKIGQLCNFSMFITTALLYIVAELTKIYSFQHIHKFINTNCAEIMPLIGMTVKMDILRLPSQKSYCIRERRCPRIADFIPCNCYQELRRHLHFMNNGSINAQDKLAKIRPLISIVRDKFEKKEPEEYNSFDEQTIASKTKCSSIRQYNPRKPKTWRFKNLVCAGISSFIYDFLGKVPSKQFILFEHYLVSSCALSWKKTIQDQIMENLVIYRNVRKLLQHYVMIFLLTKLIKC